MLSKKYQVFSDEAVKLRDKINSLIESMKTKVIFRKFIGCNSVIAIFPEIPHDRNGWACSSYMHVGQHGSADPHGIMQNTKLAAPEEYEPLKKELEKIGYTLEICKKITGKADKKRKEAATI